MAYHHYSQEQADPKQRVVLLSVLFTVLFLSLAARLWYLQILKASYYQDLSKNNRIRLHRIQALRGYIFDREGRILAENRPSFNVMVIPEDIQKAATKSKKSRNKTISLLAELIDVPLEKIGKKIKESGKRAFKPVVIKKDLSFEKVAKIEERKSELPGVMLEPQPARYYPSGKEACHVLGYMGKITERQLTNVDFSKCKGSDMVGQSGVERKFNRFLIGTDGGRQVEVTAEGRIVETIGKQTSIPGNSLYLTIDSDLQKMAEKELEGKSGSIVLMDPNNGEVLALANSPGFDPNNFSIGISSKNWNHLIKNPKKPLQNRAIQSQYASGSIFKIVTASAALSSGVLTPDVTLFCGGQFRLGKWKYDCWKAAGHGLVNMHESIVHSCNVFFYQAGLKAGIEFLDKFGFGYGLGMLTGIDLPSEKKGLMPTQKWKKKLTGEPWYRGDTVSLSIGQGYLNVTPLQLAVLISAVANDGKRYKPLIVKKIESQSGYVVKRFLPKLVGRVPISKDDLEVIKDGLRGVVNERGTGTKARIPGIIVAGKTGTAQVIVKREFHDEDQSNVPKSVRDNAWFVAFAPYEKPRIAAAILVEHGGHGGSACAPIAKKLFSAYLTKLNLLPEPEKPKSEKKEKKRENKKKPV